MGPATNATTAEEQADARSNTAVVESRRTGAPPETCMLRSLRRSPTFFYRLLRISRRSDLDRRRSFLFTPAFGPSRRTLHRDLAETCRAVGIATLAQPAAYNPNPRTTEKSNTSSSSRVVPQGVPLTICACAAAQAATEEAGRDRQIASRAGPSSDSVRGDCKIDRPMFASEREVHVFAESHPGGWTHWFRNAAVNQA